MPEEPDLPPILALVNELASIVEADMGFIQRLCDMDQRYLDELDQHQIRVKDALQRVRETLRREM